MLKIDMDDVYFLMGLLRRGEPIIFFGHQATPRPDKGICFLVLHTRVMLGRREDCHRRRDGFISLIRPIFYHENGMKY
jgi:hypothetical protein